MRNILMALGIIFAISSNLASASPFKVARQNNAIYPFGWKKMSRSFFNEPIRTAKLHAKIFKNTFQPNSTEADSFLKTDVCEKKVDLPVWNASGDELYSVPDTNITCDSTFEGVNMSVTLSSILVNHRRVDGFGEEGTVKTFAAGIILNTGILPNNFQDLFVSSIAATRDLNLSNMLLMLEPPVVISGSDNGEENVSLPEYFSALVEFEDKAN